VKPLQGGHQWAEKYTSTVLLAKWSLVVTFVFFPSLPLTWRLSPNKVDQAKESDMMARRGLGY
jgi:hypothetical protein